MNELMAALAEAERSLVSGTLGLEGLDSACNNARELYERLVVLRHKARESALAGTLQSEPGTDTHKAEQAPSRTADPAPEAVPPAIRLDTRPAEVSPRQTSLIEAIEATEDVPALKSRSIKPRTDTSKSAPKQATLAEKLEKAPVADLPKAISLSHKFWFVAELFNGDRIAYEKTVTLLNSMEAGDEARRYMQEEVLVKLKKPADPEALSTFMDLLERRFA